MRKLLLFSILFLLGCQPQSADSSHAGLDKSTASNTPYLVVLGIAQDAGYPQAGCRKSCCQLPWKDEHERRLVSCLALVDPATNEGWLFDATPDFKEQLHRLENLDHDSPIQLAGIFLTHAHIGHYTGLMNLGREVMGAENVPVFAMPRMRAFLENNGPWSQLVRLHNIKLFPLQADSSIVLNSKIKVTPVKVPHREEFSETVGFEIEGPNKKVLFIPDIDKWHLWDHPILEVVKAVDYAFLDGSFFQNGEIPGRDMSEIPHPFLVESMELFKDLSGTDKTKIHFIHFNHTNPVLIQNSEARRRVLEAGFNIAEEGLLVPL